MQHQQSRRPGSRYKYYFYHSKQAHRGVDGHGMSRPYSFDAEGGQRPKFSGVPADHAGTSWHGEALAATFPPPSASSTLLFPCSSWVRSVARPAEAGRTPAGHWASMASCYARNIYYPASHAHTVTCFTLAMSYAMRTILCLRGMSQARCCARLSILSPLRAAALPRCCGHIAVQARSDATLIIVATTHCPRAVP